MTILWIRFIEGGTICAFTKSVKNILKSTSGALKINVEINFGLKRPSPVTKKKLKNLN